MNNKSYSRYRNLNSIIHKIDPLTKFFAFMIIITTIFLSQTSEELIVVTLFLLIISLFARVKFFSYIKTIIFLIPFFLSMLILNIIFYQNFKSSLFFTLKMCLRLYIFIILSVVYTSTTKEMEIANSIESVMRPLRLIKVPTYEISMMIMLAIRFIPLIISDMEKILISQTSRGINSINGNIKEKSKAIKNSLLPMFILAFKRADDISLSMSIRGYEIGKKRTKFIKNKFFIYELITMLISFGLLTVIILMNSGIIDGAWF